MNETWAISGHRGARGEAPENTLAGFRYAVHLGLQSVELDVQLSADEELMVIHDDTVDRTTDGHGLVAEMTRAELGQLDARSVFAGWPEPCPVPTLGEVLDVLGPMADITVEIKSDVGARLERVVPKVIAEVGARNLVQNVTITSFDPVALEFAQRLLPEGQRGLTGIGIALDYLERAIELGCCRADVAVYWRKPRSGRSRESERIAHHGLDR